MDSKAECTLEKRTDLNQFWLNENCEILAAIFNDSPGTKRLIYGFLSTS